MDLKCKDPGGLVCRDLGAYTVVYFSLFSLGSLIAISLQIGFPIEENFSSYSVITFPAHMTGVIKKAFVVSLKFDCAVSS